MVLWPHDHCPALVMPTWWTGWRVRDADTFETELGSRAFWGLIKENGGTP